MDTFFLSSLLTIFLLFFTISIFYSLFTRPRTSTGFKNYPIVGALPEFYKNGHRYLDWTTEVLASCPTLSATFRRPGGVRGVMTANPSNLEHILKINFDNYPKGDPFISFHKDFLGQGIFTSDGDIWKIQRKTATNQFNTKSLRRFILDGVTVELKERLIPLLKNACESNRVLDMQDVLERFAFDNICKLAFNVDPGCLCGDKPVGGEFMQAFEDAANLCAGRFMSPLPIFWRIKKFFNVGSEKQLRKSIEIVHRFADNIIHARKEEKTKKNDEDLLSLFIANETFSPDFLRDVVISFIVAGRDTTSSTLSWFFWLIASREDVQEKILKELKAIREKHNKPFGEIYNFDELREMHYLHATLSETLRLYPPIAADTRAVANDDILPDGTFVGKNWSITYHAYAMGRMESIWGKNCNEFLPERWLGNGMFKQESPFKFPAFHGGPRLCLGKELAYFQMKSIAASVLERFKIVVENKHVEHALSITLRVKDGLPVRVKDRDVSN